MNILKNSYVVLCAALFAGLISFSSSALAQTGDAQAKMAKSIGIILSTSGAVTAESEDGTVRKLRRRSKIYEGDVVITALRSRAQIRFNDNGLVALRPDTRFVIEEHNFSGAEDGTESATYRLLRGGLQAITGLIGNKNKSRYRFETPLATIGLRGTHWAATFCSSACNGLPPGLYGGVADGGIDVCNGGGCEGFDKDGYFYVPDADTKPQTLVTPPSVVFEDSTEREEEEDEDEGEGEGDGQGNEGDGEGDGQAGEGEGDDQGNEGEGEGDGQAQGGQAGDGGSAGGDGGSGGSEGGDSTGGTGSTTGGNSDGSTTGGSASQFSTSTNTNNNTNTNTNTNQSPTGGTTEPEFDPQEAASDTGNTGGGDGEDGGTTEPPTADNDGDGVPNLLDAFPDDPNEIADTDGDGVGDNADTDRDGDGVPNDLDPNPDTVDAFADSDGDGIFDILDPDRDGDGVENDLDPNPDTVDEFVDSDGDGIFDILDPDRDGDGIADVDDPFPDTPDPSADLDGDGIIDSLDPDRDGDGVPNDEDAFPGNRDEFADLDGDGVGDNSDPDRDGDGVENDLDPNPDTADEFADTDGDGVFDIFDADRDGDGVENDLDPNPDTADEFADLDGDGIFDILDTDIDGDGIPNDEDAFPNEFADADGDGIGDGDDPTPNGDPTTDPSPDPEPTIAVAFATISSRATDSAISDVVVDDDSGNGNSATRDASGNVTGISRDNNDDCDPCLIDIAATATLEESSTYSNAADNISVLLGRWETDGGVAISETDEVGTENTTSNTFHFAVTEDIADGVPFSTFPLIGSYELAAATSPTDGDGRTGTLASAGLRIDFLQQLLLDLGLIITFDDGVDGNRQYDAFLNEDGPVNLTDVATRDLFLSGNCTGGVCGSGEFFDGSTSFVFLGDTASALTGSYSLNTGARATSVAGAYVFELDTGNLINPLILDVNDSPIFDSPASTGSVLLTSIGIIESGSSINGQILDRAVGTGSSSGFSTGDFYIFPEVFESFASSNFAFFGVKDGMELAFFDGYSAYDDGEVSGPEIFYGIWSGEPNVIGSAYTPGSTHHFIHSDEMTTLLPVLNQLVYYNLVGATPTTDENGNFGSLNRVELVLNYYNQSVADFDIDLSVSDRNYQASLDRSNGVVVLAADMSLDLLGKCFGADCNDGIYLEGSADLQLVGANAQNVIGSYELVEDPYGGPIGPCIGGCVATTVAVSEISATGVFVLEEADQPLPFGVVNPDITPASNDGSTTAALVGTTFVDGSTLNPDATLVVQDARSNGATAGPDGASFASREYGNLGFASLDMTDPNDPSNSHTIEALAEATIYTPGTTDTTNDNVISVEDGYLVFEEEGTFGSSGDIQIYWGNWVGGINTYLSGSGAASGSPLDHVHYIYTDDFSSDLRMVPLEKLEIWYHYAGGPLPADQDGNLGYVRYTNLGVNFYQSEVSYFSTSFDIGDDNYYAEFDPYYGSGSGAAIEQHDGIYSAIFALDGDYSDCGECSNFTLTGEAIVAFVGASSEVVAGTLAVEWSGGSATQGFVLEESFGNIFDRADTDTFSTSTVPANAIAAVANIVVHGANDYESYAAIVNPAVTGDSLEFVQLNLGHIHGGGLGGSGTDLGGGLDGPVSTGEDLLSAYTSDSQSISSQVNFGEPFDSDYDYIGPNDNVSVHWGLWHATQTFTVDGANKDVINWLPYAYSDHLTSTLPTNPILGFGSVHFTKVDGNAVNEYGQEVSLDLIDMEVDFFSQQIIDFDLTASYTDMTDSITYTATNDSAVNLTSASDIFIPLEGGCTGCGSGGVTAYDMTGSTRLSFVGDNAEGAIGSFQLDSLSSTDGSHSGAGNGLYSLAGAYALEQRDDFNNLFDSSQVGDTDASNNGVGFGAAVLFNSGATSASGYAMFGIDVVDEFLFEAYTPDNAIVAGTFSNFECSVSGDCLEINLTLAELDQIDEISVSAYTATLGRWETFDQASYEDLQYDTERYFHFAFSKDETMDITTVNPVVVKYSLYDAAGSAMLAGSEFTNPTDHNGISGHVDHLSMEVNFLSQEITEFDIEAGNGAGAGTGGFHITASLPAPVALGGSSVHSFGLVGQLTDDDSGCSVDCLNDTATGIVNTAFLGSGAQAVLGSYNLGADSLQPQLAGTFLLETLETQAAQTPAPAGSVTFGAAILDAGTGTSVAGILAGTGKDAISLNGVADLSTVGTITHDNGVGTLTTNAVVTGVFSGDMTNFDAIGANFDPPELFDCANCLDVDLTPGPTDLSDAVEHIILPDTNGLSSISALSIAINSSTTRYLRYDLDNGATFSSLPSSPNFGLSGVTSVLVEGGTGSSHAVYALDTDGSTIVPVNTDLALDNITVTTAGSVNNVTLTSALFETQVTASNNSNLDILGTASDSTIVDYVNGTIEVYWGRWSDQLVTINQGAGDENYNAADLFYAYSEDLTPDVSAAVIGSTTISYSKTIGSNPIDQGGASGTLGAVNMAVNFGAQQITAFNMGLTTNDGAWNTSLDNPVSLAGAVNSFGVSGGLTPTGTSDNWSAYGDVNTALLGPNADAVLGTYNLSVIDSGAGAFQDAEAIGTFLLEQDVVPD